MEQYPTHAAPRHEPRPPGLPVEELRRLVSLLCQQWDSGDELEAMHEIRTRGSVADYEYAVNRLARHDDDLRDASLAQRMQFLTELRAD